MSLKRNENLNPDANCERTVKSPDAVCEGVEQDIAAYLDGGLVDERTAAIRAHLKSCSHCREVLARETKLNQHLRTALRVNVDPLYWQKTWPRIQASLVQRRRERRSGLLRWVAAGAGALAAAASFLIILISTPVSAQTLTLHDASHFNELPSSPPVLTEKSDHDHFSQEIASLSIGFATPDQRSASWIKLEGF